MRKNIFIFTAHGLSPDLYINIITHLFREYGGLSVEYITLLKIAYGGDSKKELKEELFTIKQNISIQLKSLINNSVKKWDRKTNAWESLLDEINLSQEFYRLYLDVNSWLDENEIATKVQSSDFLSQYLENETSNSNYEFIFDLTGAPKKDFVAISLALLSQNSRLHIFEVLRDFGSFKHQLIHEYIDEDQNDLYLYHTLNSPNYKVNKINSDLVKIKEGWRKMISSNASITEIINKIKESLSMFPESEFNEEISKTLELLNRKAVSIKKERSTGLVNTEKANAETSKLITNLQNIIDEIR